MSLGRLPRLAQAKGISDDVYKHRFPSPLLNSNIPRTVVFHPLGVTKPEKCPVLVAEAGPAQATELEKLRRLVPQVAILRWHQHQAVNCDVVLIPASIEKIHR